ncbi:FUSC family protein [Luteibacter anthropi]|uniref:FUSC family protein n=1 Tax=Luteibacter anthropi TaxID=564369 RepID=UPI00203285CB|nr:FUSC family protein [Luteibacter anthropi]URX61569.1 FUSC family protein [Luteibacter anthropi]
MRSLTTSIPYLTDALRWLDLGTPRARYVMRSVLAAALAITVSYLLELETPYSAASTVLLVVNPVQGAAIGKGAWRFIGTLGGMLASFALMAAFAQKPWLFVIGFGIWLGLCVAGMSVLRHFRGTGAVVAGYTVGLATFGAMQHPEHAFEHIVGRGSTVLIGVVCLALVFALTGTRSVRGRLEALLSRLAAHVAASVAQQIASGTSRLSPERRAVLGDIYGVDDLLSLGKAESEDVARRAASIRHAMVSLFATAVETEARAPGGWAKAWQDAADALGNGDTGHARARLKHARHLLSRECMAHARLAGQIDDFLAALDGIEGLHRTLPRNAAPVAFHRDYRGAWRNGLRAAITLILAGAFWLVTGWTDGDMMLLIVAPYCALLALAPDPAAGAWGFFKGTVVAVPAAFVCAFGILPHIDGMPLLLVSLALFWIPGIYATTLPRHGLAALAYLVGFNTLTSAANPMHYDLAQFLNWSLSWLFATAFTVLAFRVVLPKQPARDLERLRLHIRDASLSILRGATPSTSAWRWRQQHRLAQLGAMLKTRPQQLDAALTDALASLHLGRDLLRLRALREADDTTRSIRHALACMARRSSMPMTAARHARRASRQLRDASPCAADAFADIAALLDRHADYFTPGSYSSRAQ